MKFYTKYTILSVSTLIGICLSVFLGFVLYDKESSTIALNFKSDVDDKAAAFEREILLNLEVIYSIKALFDASDNVNPDEFRYISQSILSRHKNIQALEWVPKIAHSDRISTEIQRRDEHADFEITEQKDSYKFSSANQRNTYFPVYYVEPLMGNESLLGFDMGSIPNRLSVLNESRDSGKLVIINNFKRLQDPLKRGLFIIIPVFLDQPSTIEKRREKLRGFVVGVYDTQALVSSAIHQTAAVGLNLSLVDVTNSTTDVLYQNYLSSHAQAPISSDFSYQRNLFEFGGRQWHIQASPGRGYIVERRTALPLITTLFAALTVILMAFYTFLTMRHSSVIEDTVNERTRELYEAKKILEALSRTDSLTDIGNRRFFDEYLATEWNRAFREKIPLSLIMLDIDHFKLFNDRYGHAAGDECLQSVAHALKNSLKRTSDLVTRYGGEEFIIILPNTEDASVLAETCRKNIERLKISHEESSTFDFITVSIGIATIIPEHDSSISDFMYKVDSSLYEAKSTGRNRVVGGVSVTASEKVLDGEIA